MENQDGNRNLIVLESRKAKKDAVAVISQFRLEELFSRRRELRELEEELAIALSKGARVEAGVHTAELVPERRTHGNREIVLKLVILLVLLTVPLLGLRASLVRDVNGDGKADIVDLELILAGAGIAKSWPAGVERTAHA